MRHHAHAIALLAGFILGALAIDGAAHAQEPAQWRGEARGVARKKPLALTPSPSFVEKVRASLPPGYVLSLDEQRILLSWTQTELECCAPSGQGASHEVRRTLILELGAPMSPQVHERQSRDNEKALAELQRLQGKMEAFSERHFATSRSTYEPRNTEERALTARCKRLLATLNPLPGYRVHDEATEASITIRGDLPSAEVLEQILALLSPSGPSEPVGRETVVYANFWMNEDVSPLDDSRDCRPNADYSQSRSLVRTARGDP